MNKLSMKQEKSDWRKEGKRRGRSRVLVTESVTASQRLDRRTSTIMYTWKRKQMLWWSYSTCDLHGGKLTTTLLHQTWKHDTQ